MIEAKGLLGKGEIGEPIDAYLVPKWWATQTCGLLAGPIEVEIYFYFSFLFLNYLFILFLNLT